MAEGQDFLVRVTSSPVQFVKDIDGSTVDVTDTPSWAKFFDYRAAAVLSDRLRRHGWPQAVVTDLGGLVMTYESLQAYQRGLATSSASTKASTSDNLPQTLAELNKIPVADQRRRYRSDSRFAARVDQLEGTA